MNAELANAWVQFELALKWFTEDCEESGPDNFNLDAFNAIPRSPKEFCDMEWNRIRETGVNAVEADDKALMVRLAVLNLHEVQEEAGLGRKLSTQDGRAQILWMELCKLSRVKWSTSYQLSESELANEIFKVAWELKHIAAAKATSGADIPRFIFATSHRDVDKRDLAVALNGVAADSSDDRSDNQVAVDTMPSKSRKDALKMLWAVKKYEERKQAKTVK